MGGSPVRVDRLKDYELTFTKEEWECSPFKKGVYAQYWENHGEPILWVETFNVIGIDHVTAYVDMGHGYLKLIVNSQVVIKKANMVINRGYVLLSGAYGAQYEGKVFKQIN